MAQRARTGTRIARTSGVVESPNHCRRYELTDLAKHPPELGGEDCDAYHGGKQTGE